MFRDAENKSAKQRGRPFKAGASGNPHGRPRGSRNKRTRAVIEAAEAGGELPLDYMLKVMRDSSAKSARRDEMAFVKSIAATDDKSQGDSPAALPPIVQIVFSDEKE